MASMTLLEVLIVNVWISAGKLNYSSWTANVLRFYPFMRSSASEL